MSDTLHEVKPSGAGWLCTCGVWGWTAVQSNRHLKDSQISPAERAVDEAYEKNCK